MPLQYNLDFLYVALLFSLLIFCHFKSQPSPGSVNDRIFSFFFAIGIIDILFDIITTQLIMLHDPALRWVTIGCLTVFYWLQVAVPSSFLCYIFSLRQNNNLRLRHIVARVIVPVSLLTLMIFINVFTGIIFWSGCLRPP